MTYTDPAGQIFRGPTKGSPSAHICETCHGPLSQAPGPGRRRMRHEACKAFADAFRALDKAVLVYRDSGHVDYALTRELRARLWSTANTLNTIGDDRGRA